MNVRTAAYLAMTLHFARKILRRVLAPHSREPHTGYLDVDQLIVAVPGNITPGFVVAVAEVPAGTSWKAAMDIRRAAERHLDKCTVCIIDRDAGRNFCEGRKAMRYASVPERLLSSRRATEFVAELDRLHVCGLARIL